MHKEIKPAITKIQIVSNNICYGPRPEPGDEVEQELVIERDGQVAIAKFAYGGGDNKLMERERFSVGKEKAETIFDALCRCFYEDYEAAMVTDVGSWKMSVFDTEGNRDKFSGPLVEFNRTTVDGESLSDTIRANLERKDLFVFDGNPEKIDRVELSYHRVTKIELGQQLKGVELNFMTWDYGETLIIDRKSETLEIRNRIGEGCEVTHTYFVQGGIETLLDNMQSEWMSAIEGNPPNAITDPLETRTYAMKVMTTRGIETAISGTYDKKGLPSAWPEFIENLQDFMVFYGFPGEIFSERYFGKVLRRKGEIIFCDVIFEEGGKAYTYIADTDDFCVGDLVVVPAGAFGRKAVGRIEGIHYLTEEKAPFPIEKTNHVIGAYDPDEDV